MALAQIAIKADPQPELFFKKPSANPQQGQKYDRMIAISYRMIAISYRMITISYRMITISCRMIAISYRMITISCRMIAISYRMITISCRMIAISYRMIAISCRMIAISCRMIAISCRMVAISSRVSMALLDPLRAFSASFGQEKDKIMGVKSGFRVFCVFCRPAFDIRHSSPTFPYYLASQPLSCPIMADDTKKTL